MFFVLTVYQRKKINIYLHCPWVCYFVKSEDIIKHLVQLKFELFLHSFEESSSQLKNNTWNKHWKYQVSRQKYNFSLLSKCCIIRITVSLKFNNMWKIHCRVSLLNGINPLSLNNIYWYLAILLPPHPGPIRAASHWLFSSFRLRYFGKLSHIISAYCKAGLIKKKNIFLKAIIISI